MVSQDAAEFQFQSAVDSRFNAGRLIFLSKVSGDSGFFPLSRVDGKRKWSPPGYVDSFPRLRLVTSLAMRANSKSRLVNEFVKAAGRKFGCIGQTAQRKLRLPCDSFSLEQVRFSIGYFRGLRYPVVLLSRISDREILSYAPDLPLLLCEMHRRNGCTHRNGVKDDLPPSEDS